jgi:hypothetical protein
MKIFMNSPFPDETIFNKHLVSKFPYGNHIKVQKNFKSFISRGLRGNKLGALLADPGFLHKLYREKDKGYFNYLEAFREKYRDFDVIVSNPGVDLIHPEFLYKNFKNSLKVLHFIDDPHLTYSYNLPFSWAFDAATYISPSYSLELNMKDLLELNGFKHIKWVPHCVTNLNEPSLDLHNINNQIINRKKKVIYVGNFYSGKQDRLSFFKNKLGNKFDIFGNFPLNGYMFPLLSILNGYPSTYRVRSISGELREKYYNEYAVGINMHLNSPSIETGNARLYELAFRGVAQVVDTSNISLVDKIFEPEKEILTYRNKYECVEQVERLLLDDNLRITIAKNAYLKSIKSYQLKNVILEQIKWFNRIISKK